MKPLPEHARSNKHGAKTPFLDYVTTKMLTQRGEDELHINAVVD